VSPPRYRRAVVADIPLLALHHRLMFAEMRRPDAGGTGLELCCHPDPRCCSPECGEGDFDRLEAAQAAKLGRQLPDAGCVAWLAEIDQEVVASGVVTFLHTTPVPEDPTSLTALLHSLYTRPRWRRQGIGRALVQRLLESCRERSVHRVQLHSAVLARDLYARLGFRSRADLMEIWL